MDLGAALTGGSPNAAAPSGRAFAAQSLEEEKRLVLGKAHLARAADRRWQVQEKVGKSSSEEVAASKEICSELYEELEECLQKDASSEVLADEDTMTIVKALRARGGMSLSASSTSSANGEGEGEGEGQSRAFEALCFEEEKDRIIGKAHLVLAARHRAQQHLTLKSGWSDRREAEEVLFDRRTELDRNMSMRASSEVLADKDAMRVAMAANGEDFERLNEELRNDPEVALAAIGSFPRALRHIGLALRLDRDLMLKAVRLNEWVLEYASPALRRDKEVVLAAIQSHPWALRLASPALQGDRDVVLAALRGQTQADTMNPFGEKLLAFASEVLRADREVVLEAVKSDGAAVAHASLELRADKDFILQATRTAPEDEHLNSFYQVVRSTPLGQHERCYDQADPSVRQAVTLEEFQGAANSVLAVAGEDAPVLTVTLTRSTAPGEGSLAASPGGCFSCEASLISGASFSCSFPDRLGPPQSDFLGLQADSEPAPKRAKLNGSSEGQAQGNSSSEPISGLTVAQLAELLLAEIYKRLKIEPPPCRLFLVLEKAGSDGEGMALSPWDWNRPVGQFL